MQNADPPPPPPPPPSILIAKFFGITLRHSIHFSLTTSKNALFGEIFSKKVPKNAFFACFLKNLAGF